MGNTACETYTNAGILKKAGNALRIDLAGAEFFLMHEDLSALQHNQAADIVNCLGEAEGVAWLSPLAARTKTDLTGIIASHIYVIPYQRFCRVMGGHQQWALVREYHPAS